MARYNRASLDDTVRVGLIAANRANADRYIFATAYGYTIWHERPPGTQSYVLCQPTGDASEQRPLAILDEQPEPTFATQPRLI